MLSPHYKSVCEVLPCVKSVRPSLTYSRTNKVKDCSQIHTVEDVLKPKWFHLDSHTAQENARFWISKYPGVTVAKPQHAHNRLIILMFNNKCQEVTSSALVQSLLIYASRVCYIINLPSSCSNTALQYTQPG
jgi:hypothetical protein